MLAAEDQGKQESVRAYLGPRRWVSSIAAFPSLGGESKWLVKTQTANPWRLTIIDLLGSPVQSLSATENQTLRILSLFVAECANNSCTRRAACRDGVAYPGVS